MITRRNANFWWDIMRPRDRKPYGYGGRWDRNDTNVTTDCSGIVSNCLEALVRGPDGFDWDREPYSTESWRVVQVGQVGPFGTICVNRPEDIPASAAVRIGCQHGGGGRNSHMACTVYDPVVGTINVESSGSNGQRMGGPARGYNDGLFHDWHYLPGPIEGGVAPPPPPVLGRVDRYALLVMAEGQRRGVTPRGIQIAFSVCFVESNWKNYANSNVPESLLIPHDAVGSDHDSLGLFQQRCPMWGPAEVLMNPTLSAGLFYDRLVKMDYNNPARLPGDFAADVQRPAAQYRYRYQERMGDAVSLYNKVVGITAPPPPGEDELSAEAERKIAEIHAKQFDSLSMYAVGPRKVPQAEAYGWDQRVESSALRGEEWALSLVRQAGDGTLFGVLRDGKPDQFLVEHARAVYREAVTTPADGPTTVARLATSPQVVEKIVYRDPPPAPAALPEIVYLPAPLPDAPLPEVAALAPVEDKTPGQLIGDAYDALENLRLADALPIENRAPLAALIAVLQTKNGSQI